MTLENSEMLCLTAKAQYLCTLVHGELLFQFDLLSDYVEIANPLTAEAIFRISCILFHWIFVYKQKHKMLCRTRNPRGLKVRRYGTCLVDLNEYLALFHGAKLIEKNGITELNKVDFNSMPNSCSTQMCLGIWLWVYYFKNDINIIERMEIVESSYKDVEQPPHSKLLGKIPTVPVMAE